MIVDDLRNDPGYAGGEYTTQPAGLKAAVDMLWIFGSAPLYNQSQFPTSDQADAYYANTVKKNVARYDANDMIYQFESSRDYNPQPDLGKITVPLLAINSADDQINPPELGIAEREIEAVRHGRFLLIPISEDTRGHGTHTLARVWVHHLDELLATRVDVRLPRRRDGRTSLENGVTVALPAGWVADINPEGIHEFGIGCVRRWARSRSTSSSRGRSTVTTRRNRGDRFASTARAHIDESYTGETIMSIVLGEAGAVHYAWIRNRTGDSVARQIAYSLRVDDRPKKC